MLAIILSLQVRLNGVTVCGQQSMFNHVAICIEFRQFGKSLIELFLNCKLLAIGCLQKKVLKIKIFPQLCWDLNPKLSTHEVSALTTILTLQVTVKGVKVCAQHVHLPGGSCIDVLQFGNKVDWTITHETRRLSVPLPH